MTCVKISATIEQNVNDELETILEEKKQEGLNPKFSQIVNMILKKGIQAYRNEKGIKST